MAEKTVSETMKELLSGPERRIELDDFVSSCVKKFLGSVNPENFPAPKSNISKEDFISRLHGYEEKVAELQQVFILLARWNTPEHLLLMEKALARIAEAACKDSFNIDWWAHLSWYPICILMYSGGIAALSGRRYEALKTILESPIVIPTEGKRSPLVVPTFSNLSSLHDHFKWIPDMHNKHTPRSMYLLKMLQPQLEDLLFLGESYESLFDEFEVMSALVYADATNRGWGPVGNFGWKQDRGYGETPFNRVFDAAKKEEGCWGPIKAGLFQSSWERFQEIHKAFGTTLNEKFWG